MESTVARKCASPGRPAARSPPRRKAKVKRVKILPGCGAALTLLLGACSLAPPLKTPDVPTADAYKEMGQWTQAQPAHPLPRGSWWALYRHTDLDDVQQRLISAN